MFGLSFFQCVFGLFPCSLCASACVSSVASHILQSDPLRVCVQNYFVYILTHAAQNGTPRELLQLEGEMSYNVLFSFDCSCPKSDFTYPVSVSTICNYNDTQRKLLCGADTMFVTEVWADNEWRCETDPGPAALTYILPFSLYLKQKYSQLT